MPYPTITAGSTIVSYSCKIFAYFYTIFNFFNSEKGVCNGVSCILVTILGFQSHPIQNALFIPACFEWRLKTHPGLTPETRGIERGLFRHYIREKIQDLNRPQRTKPLQQRTPKNRWPETGEKETAFHNVPHERGKI